MTTQQKRTRLEQLEKRLAPPVKIVVRWADDPPDPDADPNAIVLVLHWEDAAEKT